MKALILNSGTGSRMGEITKSHPKCMTEINSNETIVSRQLKLLSDMNIKEIIMTTGLFDDVLEEYCESLNYPIKIRFVKNPIFRETNYIYSIYCAKDYLDDDIIMMHGDLVFSKNVLKNVMQQDKSCMTVSSTVPLPEKDFKAIIKDGKIEKVGINFFDNALSAQPLYKLNREDWKVWLKNIENYCEKKQTSCYAENAFNEVSNKCKIYPLDVKDELCAEIDNPDDLKVVSEKLKQNEMENK